jgi:hypothetical protein
LEGVQQQQKLPKTPGNADSDALLMSRFENCAAAAAQKKRAPRGFLRASCHGGFN